MPKTIYTERDIDDLKARGVLSVDVDDNVVLTDLARERALKQGMRVNRIEHKALPVPSAAAAGPGPTDEELVKRIKSAVLARLNGQVEASLLDTVIRRVISGMKP